MVSRQREKILDSSISQELWEEFFPRLARFAKRKLKNLPQRAFDEEDIALSALNSFFTGINEGRFELKERDELWRILATIAQRKVIHQNRMFFAKKRGGGKIRGESVYDSSHFGLGQVTDPNVMPEMETKVIETCEHLLSCLPNEKLRSTAVLRLQGFNNGEISQELGCSVARTKQRVSKIKEIWSRLGYVDRPESK